MEDIKRNSLPVLPFLFLLLFSVVPPSSYDFTSDQEGDWTTGSTWKEAGAPACATEDKILIDGDTVTANCKIELSGGGAIVLRNEGYLIIEDGMEIKGDAEVDVGDDAGLKVKGNLTVSGSGTFTTDGETEVHGDLEVAGANATAKGSGTLDLSGTGCVDFTGTGDCNDSQSLPVELIGFTVENVGEGVRVYWVTATEERNDRFLVQRSGGGLEFKTIEEIDGHGTTTREHVYELTDDDPYTGQNYYRLVQIDLDGERTVYGPKAVTYEREERVDCEMEIRPNPCRGNCKVVLQGDCDEGSGMLNLELYDLSGNLVKTRMERTDGFQGTEFHVDASQRMSPGVYVVRAVSSKGQVASEKMKKK